MRGMNVGWESQQCCWKIGWRWTEGAAESRQKGGGGGFWGGLGKGMELMRDIPVNDGSGAKIIR